jgi:hypothetical protein
MLDTQDPATVGEEHICRCPTTWHLEAPYAGPLYVVGCGAIFCAEPDHERLVDCPECGIWFDPEVDR